MPRVPIKKADTAIVLRPQSFVGRTAVIQLTRLNNQQITLNSDLIKFIESKPDTVITLVNGDKVIVHESVEDVIARVVEFRRSLFSGLSPQDCAAGMTLTNTTLELHKPEGSSRG